VRDLEALAQSVRLLVRTDLVIAELKLRQVATKASVLGFAALAAGFGAVMLGYAGFLALEQVYGPILAATISGGAAVALAVLLAFIGLKLKSGRELALANEIHAAALQAVSRDLQATGASAQRFAALVTNPLGNGLPALIMPVLGVLLRFFRRGGDGKGS